MKRCSMIAWLAGAICLANNVAAGGASITASADGYIVKSGDFQNFSEVIPHLEMEWTLLKRMARAEGGRGRR